MALPRLGSNLLLSMNAFESSTLDSPLVSESLHGWTPSEHLAQQVLDGCAPALLSPFPCAHPPAHFRRARMHDGAASRTCSRITHPPRSHTPFITATLCHCNRCSQPRRCSPTAAALCARGSAEMRALRRGRGHIGRALHSRRTCSRSARKLATNCVLSKLRTLTRPIPRLPARRVCVHPHGDIDGHGCARVRMPNCSNAVRALAPEEMRPVGRGKSAQGADGGHATDVLACGLAAAARARRSSSRAKAARASRSPRAGCCSASRRTTRRVGQGRSHRGWTTPMTRCGGSAQ